MKISNKLKSLIILLKSSSFIYIYRRLAPIVIGLSVISAFLITKPTQAINLYNQFLHKTNIRPITETIPEFDLITPINQKRAESNLSELTPNSVLDHVARLVAISLADDPEKKDIDIGALALASSYPYHTIAFLAAINPLPVVAPPTDLWLVENLDDINNQDIKEIGSSQFEATIDNQKQIISIIVLGSQISSNTKVNNSNQDSTTQAQPDTPKDSYYTGTELWAELQKYRREHGVPEFSQENTLCTLASIRVNQLIELGKLDNHDGFKPLVDKYRSEDRLSFSSVAENILSGYPTAVEAIAAWDGSLGHRSLMQDGSYVWGCAAANHGFAVLIAAF